MPLLPWGGVGWGRRSCTAAGTEFSESESIAPAVLFSGALSLCSLRSAQGWLIHSAFAILLHRFLSPTSSLPPPQNVLCSARIPCSRTRRRPTLARDHLGPRKARDARKRPVRLVDVVPHRRPQGWIALPTDQRRRRRPQELCLQGPSVNFAVVGRAIDLTESVPALTPLASRPIGPTSTCSPNLINHPDRQPPPACCNSPTVLRPPSPSPEEPSSSEVSSLPPSPESTSS